MVPLCSPCLHVHYAAHMLFRKETLAVNTHEAARMLSVSPRTIQYFIAAKLLTARKIGRRTVIPVQSLEVFLRSDHASPVQVARSVAEAGA